MDNNLKLLIKFPSRGRPEKFFNVLDQYIEKADNVDKIAFLISLDADDESMQAQIPKLDEYKAKYKFLYVFGNSKTKMQAINADMDSVVGWDIVLLASDDMIPILKGYDTIIRKDMSENFSDLDGVLWYNDGGQNKINTLCILGKKYYDRFGYIYHPEYVSLWCDNEFTDISVQLKKVFKSEQVIIEHQHPVYQKTNYDELYVRNESYFPIDQQTYERRKLTNFGLPAKKLIVFCVYGTKPMYLEGAIKNAQLAKELYPDWVCRFYVFAECHHLIPRLQDFHNVEIVIVKKTGRNYSMLYRFLPFQEPNVSHFMSRDTDSRLSYREVEAVNEWLASGKSFHIMKDHPNHYTPEFPILGGMFGAKGGTIPTIEKEIIDFINSRDDMHGMDQHFLYNIYHKYAINDNITHDSNFPSERNIHRDKIWFVGQPIDENDDFCERFHTQFMKNILIYVGAHHGNGLSNYVDKYDQVYAFEANPNFYPVLRQRFSRHPHVKIINAAICEEHNSTLKFNISKNNGDSSSIFVANKDNELFGCIESHEQVEVPTVNLCNFFRENDITTVKSYISDLQGYDFIVLKTLKDWIDNGHIYEIQCEVEKDNMPTIYVNEDPDRQNKEKNFDLYLGEKYDKVASGWGVLEDGKFEPVPENWSEFDCKWRIKHA